MFGKKKIKGNVFVECSKKEKNVEIPSGIEEIGAGAFDSCVELVEVVIPDGVKKIGDKAFFNCTNIVAA